MNGENNKSPFLITIVAVIAAAIISGGLGYTFGINAARNPLGVGPATMTPPPGGVHDIMGTVESVSGTEITLKANQLPFAPKAPSQRIVVVDKDTVIEKLIQKSSDSIKREMDEFLAKLKKAPAVGTSTPPVMPPLPFGRKTVELKDIKEGDVLMVSAKEDITSADKFTATRISIQIATAVPTPVAPMMASSTVPVPPPVKK